MVLLSRLPLFIPLSKPDTPSPPPPPSRFLPLVLRFFPSSRRITDPHWQVHLFILPPPSLSVISPILYFFPFSQGRVHFVLVLLLFFYSLLTQHFVKAEEECLEMPVSCSRLSTTVGCCLPGRHTVALVSNCGELGEVFGYNCVNYPQNSNQTNASPLRNGTGSALCFPPDSPCKSALTAAFAA